MGGFLQAISTLQSLLGNSELRELYTVSGTEVEATKINVPLKNVNDLHFDNT